MTVEDGLIQTHGGMGLLYWTGGKLGDCVIRVVYKMRDHNDNSGVFIRIPIEPREAWMPVHYGYEVQIDNEPEEVERRRLSHHRNALFAHQAAGPPRQTGAGVEHHGNHSGRPSHHRGVERGKGNRVHRRRSGAAQEDSFEPERGRVRKKATSACRITATTTSFSSKKSRSGC